MTREDADFIGAMNMCDEISDEAYKKIMCHCEEQQPCDDAISREAALEAILTRVPDFCGSDEGGNLVGRNETASYIRNLPSVTPKQKTGEWIELKVHKPEAYEDVLVRDIDGDVTCAYLCDDTDFLERFSGEIIDDVVEWMEIPGYDFLEMETRNRILPVGRG